MWSRVVSFCVGGPGSIDEDEVTFDPLCWCGFPIEENVLDGETPVDGWLSPAYGGSWNGAFMALSWLAGIDGTTASPELRNGFVSETKLSVDADTG